MNIEIISRDTAEKIITGGFSENTAVISFYNPKSRRTPTGYIALDYSGVCNRVFYVGIHDIDIEIHGRHDPIIVPRAVVVVEAMAAITILDAMLENMSSRVDRVVEFYK